MATIVHFDISAKDADRAKKFYTELFDWKITTLPGPMNYSLIETTDHNGKPGVGGGISKADQTPEGIAIYVGVNSLNASISKVTSLGGEVVTPIQQVPGWGELVICKDTEGNKFGLFQEAVH